MRMNSRTTGEKIFQVFLIMFFILASFIFLAPVLNVLAMSFSGTNAILRGDVGLWPVDFTTIGYEQVFQNDNLINGYTNSIMIVLVHTPINLIMTTLAAYPVSFGDFKGRRLYNLMIVLTMWVAGGMIPSFMIIKELGMLDSLWALIIPPLMGAYNIIVIRNYFDAIPKELVESAKIDGAHDFKILFSIIIPIAKPVLATVTLWIVVARWNEYMPALMYITDRTKHTLQVVLRNIIMASEISDFDLTAPEGTLSLPEQLRNASIILSMIPMLIIYPFIQKYFVTGIMAGSVKG